MEKKSKVTSVRLDDETKEYLKKGIALLKENGYDLSQSDFISKAIHFYYTHLCETECETTYNSSFLRDLEDVLTRKTLPLLSALNKLQYNQNAQGMMLDILFGMEHPYINELEITSELSKEERLSKTVKKNYKILKELENGNGN